MRRCAYCGGKCRGYACRGHADLTKIEAEWEKLKREQPLGVLPLGSIPKVKR